MRLRTQAALHLAARAASALVSSILFAWIARRLSQEQAKTVFFLSFTVGFLAVFLRSFAMLQCNLSSRLRRGDKLRRVVDGMHQLLRLAPALALAVAGLLWLHPVHWALLMTALTLVLAAGFDADLVHACLDRPPLFASAFTAGSVLGVMLLWAVPGTSVEVAVAALLCPWVPVALLNLRVVTHVLRRRRTPNARGSRPQSGAWAGSLGLAAYDGLVLNAPFVAGVSLAPAAGFDLSIAARIFSSAQPLFPLVMHWSNAGALARLAARARSGEALVFAGLLVGSGLLASVVFAALYVAISGKSMTGLQYGLFVLLLLAYCAYATAIRYRAGNLSSPTRLVVLGTLLAAALLLAWLGWPWLSANALGVVALQAAALAAAAAILARLAANNGDSSNTATK